MKALSIRSSAIFLLIISGCELPGQGLVDRFSNSSSNQEQNSISLDQTIPNPTPTIVEPEIPTPFAPINVRSSSIMPNSAMIIWDAPAGQRSEVTYNIYQVSSGNLILVDQNIPGSTYSLSGLVPGSTNSYVIRAVDQQKFSMNSTPIVVITPLLIPGTPVGLATNTITSSAFNASWSSVSNAANYRLSEATGKFSEITSTSLNTSIQSLSPSTNYSIRVRACNSAGICSANSGNVAVSTTAAPAPAIPVGLAANTISQTSFSAIWGVVSGAANYKLSEVNSKFSEITVTSPTRSLSGLTPSTAYSIRVKACNSAGACSANSPNVNVTTLASPAPAVPTGLASSAITQNSFTISWTAVSGAVNYKITEAATKFSEMTVNSPTSSLSGLNPSVVHLVRVKACNSAGLCSANSSELSVRTLDPPAPAIPTGLNSSSITHQSLSVSWTAVSGATSYKISEASSKFGEISVTTNSSSITALTASTAYSIRVKACNSASICSVNSGNLNVSTVAAPAPNPPVGLASSLITQISFTVSWAAVSGATSYKVSEAAAKFPEVSVSTTSRSITGLVANTNHQVQVKSCNSAGTCSISTSLTVSTAAIPVPSPSPSPSPSPTPTGSSVPAVITPPGTFTPGLPSDATDIKRSIPLKAFVSKNPDQITIQLQNVNSVTRTGSIQVFTKVKGTTNWGTAIGSIATSADSLTFNAIRGVHYEIKVTGTLSSGAGLGYHSAGIEVDSPTYRGKVLLVIDNQMVGSIQTELTNFKNTLIADGWIPIDVLVNRTDAVTVVKAAMQTAYNADPGNVKSAILIGRIPVAYSGNGAPDGHGDHVGVWPTDQYFADFSTWPSGGGAITQTGYRLSTNITKFSPSITPSELEIEIGRVDMQSLSNDAAGVVINPENEVAMMKSYLNRSSDYKKGAVAVNSNRAIMNNTLYWAADNSVLGAFKSFTSHVGVEKLEFNAYGADYFVQEIGPSSKPVAQWVYGGGGSYFGMIGSNLDIVQLGQQSYLNRGIFFRTFGSYFGDFDTKTNMLRALISKGHGLTSSYESNPVYTHFMNLGESMGYSMLRSINSMATQNCNVNSNQECIAEYNTGAIKIGNNITTTLVYDAAYGYWGGNYMGIITNLMGDPTLRMSPVKMPSSASSSNNASKVALSWTAPSGETNVVGYNIYKVNYSGSNVTGYTKLNNSPVTTTSYNSTTNYVAGEKFLVKTVKLEKNLSGDYLNHSVGVLVTNN